MARGHPDTGPRAFRRLWCIDGGSSHGDAGSRPAGSPTFSIAGKTNATTLLGAQMFFWSRVEYVGVYYTGIPWLRTGVWGVSVVGMVMMFLQIP